MVTDKKAGKRKGKVSETIGVMNFDSDGISETSILQALEQIKKNSIERRLRNFETPMTMTEQQWREWPFSIFVEHGVRLVIRDEDGKQKAKELEVL